MRYAMTGLMVAFLMALAGCTSDKEKDADAVRMMINRMNNQAQEALLDSKLLERNAIAAAAELLKAEQEIVKAEDSKRVEAIKKLKEMGYLGDMDKRVMKTLRPEQVDQLKAIRKKYGYEDAFKETAEDSDADAHAKRKAGPGAGFGLPAGAGANKDSE